MKILFTLFTILFTLTNIYSQEFIEKLAQETCVCLEGKSTEGMTQSQKEMQMGVCMFQGIGKYKQEFDAYKKSQNLNDIDLEKFGEELGIEMAVICPSFIINFVDPAYFSEDPEADYSLEVELGKIKSIDKKQFNTVNLEIGDGSILKFLWLWDFEGSEILIKEQLKNKWINVFYSNIMLYDPEKKTYINYKVVEGITFGE